MTKKFLTQYHVTVLSHKLRNQAIAKVMTELSDHFDSDVGIALTGLSGILVGVPVADKLEREFAIIRKEGEKRHADPSMEGSLPDKYVIIDDFICSGSTIERVVDTINKEWAGKTCVGVILYNVEVDERYTKQQAFLFKGNTEYSGISIHYPKGKRRWGNDDALAYQPTSH